MVLEISNRTSRKILYLIGFLYLFTIVGSGLAYYIITKSYYYGQVINYAGKVRGGVQRVVKLYIAGDTKKSLQVAQEVDQSLEILSLTVDNLKIPFLDRDKNFQPTEVKACWEKLKKEIESKTSNIGKLVNQSEECWHVSDKTTDFYQEIAERNIQLLEGLYYTDITLALLLILLLIRIVYKEVIGHLEFKAHFDPLTHVFNRGTFLEFYKALSRNKSFFPLSLIMFDLDHFKEINDKYGHNVGDKVLKSVAQVVKKNLRSTDIFARWGGEEFIILLPDTDLAEAVAIAEQLRKEISKIKIPELGDRKITASFGVTPVWPNEPLKQAVSRADEALYESKRRGRNRIFIIS
ncbi:MAG: GGDEF domain-containing protein [Aquificae bacterium]|nr:GGDEF domain-containing protein [Aquificota bacterium]